MIAANCFVDAVKDMMIRKSDREECSVTPIVSLNSGSL